MRKVLDLFFPPLCLHCEKRCSGRLFCEGCAAFFELIDPSTRCPYCFCENESKNPCLRCKQGKKWLVRKGAALDFLGPIATFVHLLKNGKEPHLAKSAASFMIVQWERLKWPVPDYIIPIPKRRWYEKENHAALLAQQVAKIMQKPLLHALWRDFDLPQAEKCAKNLNFYLKQRKNIEHKTVLLIDDLILTGETIERAALALNRGCPDKIFALSFCRGIKD